VNPFEPPDPHGDKELPPAPRLRESRLLFWNRILGAACGVLLTALALFALIWTPPEMRNLWLFTSVVGVLLVAVALGPLVRRRRPHRRRPS